MNNNNYSKIIKKLIREAVSANSNCPIQIVSGSSPPKLCGRSYYYTNRSGAEIRYPNAYRRAWGKPIYMPSTRRIQVGSEWVLNSLTTTNIKLLKLKAFI
jgi:hypothetical protein